MSGKSDSPALEVAVAYHRAWTDHRLEEAMALVADDVVCDAPAGRIEGKEAFAGFMGGFAGILTGSKLIAGFGDATTAVLVYDTATVPVPSAPGAECLTVHHGRITRIRIVFDRAPFDAARR